MFILFSKTREIDRLFEKCAKEIQKNITFKIDLTE